ncbi:DNA methyltransferase [Novosphingobium sp. Gsoil 351]|uniref:site-specific DNA-methyltransferase n=1 Tax=Novosphingobium sp. Gsoil 351 TaxID=2675225 RepID=UPI0012B46738|nr:DNA methyltransferase [Novosphingobium sp. Gsoil 351]QGN55012.1 DNA methylase N-4 [Novosphingobium sp. Gsoil 351]
MTSLKLTHQDPRALVPNPRNSRIHDDDQIDKLAESINSVGFNKPVVVGAGNVIYAGHGATLAAIKLGLDTIPTVSIAHLSEAQQRAFMIADNQLGELSEFNDEILAIELEELIALDEFEITATGFELPKVDDLIERRHKPKADPADKPVNPNHIEDVARLGDLWLCGRHRLFCGSALDRESYLALLDGELAQMIISDVPFNVPIKGHVSSKADAREFGMASGEMSPEQFTAFLRTSFEHMIANSVDGSIHFIFMDFRHLLELLTAGSVYTEFKNLCCSVKSQGALGSLYRSRHELIAVFKAGKAKHINNIELGKHGRNRTNVWMAPGMNSFQKGRAEKLAMHPTLKPVGLIADAMLDCSTRGALILDPFGGSGTAMIAAERCGRRAAVIELDPHYVNVALRRFCDVTGIEPVNAATGAVVRRRK